jgi:hypothetical protein
MPPRFSFNIDLTLGVNAPLDNQFLEVVRTKWDPKKKFHCHQKRRGDVLCVCEILHVGYTDSIGIAEIFMRQKKGYYKYYFYIYILIDTKVYYLSFMDLKGLNLF